MLMKKYIVIDMGSSKIKIVHGGMEKDKIVVYEYDIVDTPEGSIQDGKIINLDVIVNVIKGVLKKNRIKGKRLVLGITGTGIITRDIQIPKSTDEEIEKILEFEAQQHFPVLLEDYILDFKVQEEIKNDEGVFFRVLLVAVPKEQIDRYMQIHKKIDMEIEAIDIPANNFFKLFFGMDYLDRRFGNKELPDEFAVLDIGSRATEVHIFSAGKLKFSRILLNGSMDIDELIANSFNVDFRKAEDLKIKSGRLIDENDTLDESDEALMMSNIIKPAVSNIMNNVNRFFEFYNSRKTGNSLDKIFICGGGSRLFGMDTFLSSYFGMPVEKLLPFDNIVYKGRKKQEEFIEDYLYLAGIIGGLLRG